MYYLMKYEPVISPCKEFGCDTVADIATLPTHTTDRTVLPGSSCLVVETGAVYILNGQDVWTEFKSS